jgi:peptidyl-tRNA hydrolase, PTH1 family
MARPLLFMNRSGRAVRALLERQDASPEQMLVVCDDFHIAFGAVRLRKSGSHGGHNGLRSIIESIGTPGFPRLRVGIGPSPADEDPADFVLERFGTGERARLGDLVGQAADCVEAVLREGLDAAMNRHNRRPDRESGAPGV